jgi:hypothetical protein
VKTILLAFLILISTATAQATVTSSSSGGQQRAQLPRQDINLQTFYYVDSCNKSKDNCEKRVIREILEASRFILYQTDSFNSKPITDAIITASKRKGMITELIFYYNKFKPEFKYAWLLNNHKILKYANVHIPLKLNKTIIIDGKTLILQNGDDYTFVKNNVGEVNKHVKRVLKYRERSTFLKQSKSH